jgi:cellobiose phosphorylase
VTYKIAVERKGAGNKVALTVDGAPIEGNIVSAPADGRKEVSIAAVLS